MSQPLQVIKDEIEIEAFSCDLLNYGFTLKDVNFRDILKLSMLHMGKHTAEESQHRASHVHTKLKVCWTAAIFLHKASKNRTPPCGTRKPWNSTFTSSKIQKCSTWQELTDIQSNSRKKASISASIDDANVAGLVADNSPGWPMAADSTAAVWCLPSSSVIALLPRPATEKWKKREKSHLNKHNNRSEGKESK